MSRFRELQGKASKLGIVSRLGNAVDNFLDQARINADDTVYVEKESSEWDSVALSSLESLLAYSDDEPAKRWFKRAGITW